uniref:adenylate kinase n=1 Tax=Nymphaea colorata TaxID=210225 RepID=A0A5K1HIS4_9MAGN|nr:unnamed protein product [Nymphaea colorata]
MCYLVKKYGFIHLSTGDLLRDEIKTGSQLGKEIDAVIKEGKLVSSELMVRLVQEKIERNNYAGKYCLMASREAKRTWMFGSV